MISGLGHRVDEPDAAHIALALLRTTAGFPAVVSLMRGVGALADFGVVDRAMCEAVGRLTGVELAGESWLQAASRPGSGAWAYTCVATSQPSPALQPPSMGKEVPLVWWLPTSWPLAPTMLLLHPWLVPALRNSPPSSRTPRRQTDRGANLAGPRQLLGPGATR